MYKIYIINLNKDIERRLFMEKQILDLGFYNYEFIEAVNGEEYIKQIKCVDFNTNNMEYEPILAKKYNGNFLSKGEVGCAISHKICLQKFLGDSKIDDNIKYAVILEDDILIKDRDFKNILEKELNINQSKKRWEYLQFDYEAPGIYAVFSYIKVVLKQRLYNRLFFRLPFIILLNIYEGFRNMYFRGVVDFLKKKYLAGCYVINIDGADKLLKMNKKIIFPADRLQIECIKKYNLKLKYYCPIIIFQQRHRFASNIEMDNIKK